MATLEQLRFAAQRLEYRLNFVQNNQTPGAKAETNALRIAIDTLRANAAERLQGETHASENHRPFIELRSNNR